MSAFEKLLKVQSEVRAPKDAYNSFGKYTYRSCESILEAVKPILEKHKATIFMVDTIHPSGDRTYVESTVNFVDIEDSSIISVTASAREADAKKGMDEAQITGAASSYARKYALAGLLLLDDNKDPDATNKHGKGEKKNGDVPFPEVPDKISVKEAQVIDAFLDRGNEKEPGFKAKILSHYKVKSTSELTPEQYVDICRHGNQFLYFTNNT